LSSVRKWTEQEEQLLRDLHEKIKSQGGKKEVEFEKLSVTLGRSSMAVGRKYYDMFPVGKKKEVVVQEVERVDERTGQTGGRHEKILWTEKSINILKQELLNQIKNKTSNVRTYEILADKLKMGFSTVCTKISKVKKKLNVDTNIKLYNALVAGVSLELLNDDTILKQIKKKKVLQLKTQQKNFVEKTTTSSVQEVVSEPVEKRSFLQLLNPFYPMVRKIKKLENEIESLKSKLK
jgi:hypothetical protein